MIYLDANATTPVDPAVLEAMLPFLREHYANPAASYAGGRRVRRAIEQARAQVAALLGATPGEITFTSGGTESINAVHASVRALWPEKPELIITGTEHAAVIESARRWQARVDLAAAHRLATPAGPQAVLCQPVTCRTLPAPAAGSGSLSGTVTLTPAQAEALNKRQLFLELYSVKGTDGSLWGWFEPARSRVSKGGR